MLYLHLQSKMAPKSPAWQSFSSRSMTSSSKYIHLLCSTTNPELNYLITKILNALINSNT